MDLMISKLQILKKMILNPKEYLKVEEKETYTR
jgi:hypothetical protein